MGSITLELISPSSAEEITLPLQVFVQKRPERFIYSQHVRSGSVPIAYIENQELDSWKNIQVSNRTYGLPVNAPRVLSRRLGWMEVKSAAFSTEYKEVAITHVTGVDNQGVKRPLFWKHILPDGVVEASVYSVQSGNKLDVDTGIKKDLDAEVIYTNYRNFFDPDTGAYQLFYVVSTDGDGNSHHELLNPVPVVREATWEDIDLTTGALKDGVEVYVRERSSSGYTFYLSSGNTWYVRPIDLSLIQPVLPSGKDPDESWYMRFSYGDVSGLANSEVRRYWLPEYDTQPFFPYKPYVYSPYRKMLWVNSRTLASTRKNLAIDPDENLHLTVFVWDSDGVLIRVLTTDDSLDGTRYSDTDVFYESDKILSWDNEDGFIALGIDLLPSWEFDASYFYEANDLEYTGVSLNPIENPDALKYMYVYYIVPNVDEDDQAIHHLVVDQAGTIIDCSQSAGSSYPNLQLRNSDGTWNPDTIIGMTYASDQHTDTFLDQYTVGYNNDHAYYVLAEVVVVDTSIVEDMEVIDVSRRGGVIDQDSFASAVQANPKILQSRLGYGESGQEVPENGVMVVQVPLSLTEDYGGELTEDQVKELVRTHLPEGCVVVLRWEYPASTLTGTSSTAGQVQLSWTWEGPSLTYSLYRRASPINEWELVTTSSNPAEGTITYTDTVTSGETYYYGVRITQDGVEYPFGNSLGIRVR